MANYNVSFVTVTYGFQEHIIHMLHNINHKTLSELQNINPISGSANLVRRNILLKTWQTDITS
jgi:hypothetical protein